jgi:hypothetical protein
MVSSNIGVTWTAQSNQNEGSFNSVAMAVAFLLEWEPMRFTLNAITQEATVGGGGVAQVAHRQLETDPLLAHLLKSLIEFR